MNCPICGTGILERFCFFSLKDKKWHITNEENNNELGITMLVCSLDECGYTKMKAVPGTLSTAKRIMREELYKQYKLCSSGTEASLT